ALVRRDALLLDSHTHHRVPWHAPARIRPELRRPPDRSQLAMADRLLGSRRDRPLRERAVLRARDDFHAVRRQGGSCGAAARRAARGPWAQRRVPRPPWTPDARRHRAHCDRVRLSDLASPADAAVRFAWILTVLIPGGLMVDLCSSRIRR